MGLFFSEVAGSGSIMKKGLHNSFFWENFLWNFLDEDFTSVLEEVAVFVQVNFDICPLGFIQIPEVWMRSET